MRIDLHVHSTASDGSLAPDAVAAAARAGGLDIIAIADHDTVSGVEPARRAGTGSVHVIPAIELSTHYEGAELHMLGYFIDPANEVLVRHGARAGGAREVRMRDMLDRLSSAGIALDLQDVLSAAGPRPASIGRPHLARALVDRGYASSVADAFDRYIGDRSPAFVPTQLITPGEAIALIHAAHGLAVWAHPRADQLVTALPLFIEQGLDGVECYRPRLNAPEMDRIATVARGAGLFLTGGSDWHGEWHGRLGDFAVQRDDVADFLDLGGI